MRIELYDSDTHGAAPGGSTLQVGWKVYFWGGERVLHGSLFIDDLPAGSKLDEAVRIAVEGTHLERLRAMTQAERKALIDAIGANFCRDCGTDRLPCHCENDE